MIFMIPGFDPDRAGIKGRHLAALTHATLRELGTRLNFRGRIESDIFLTLSVESRFVVVAMRANCHYYAMFTKLSCAICHSDCRCRGALALQVTVSPERGIVSQGSG